MTGAGTPTQGFTHFDEQGRAAMVDVSAKAETERTAVARGRVVMDPATLARIQEGGVGKGDVLGVARLAGIMAAKRTAELIPLCHPLMLVKVTGRTGVEMEALTAVTVAALTVYDMCKALDRSMRIEGVRLAHKSGGKSGTYEAA